MLGALSLQLDTMTPLMVVAGCNAFHLALDPLLIFGMGWGVSGAAAATAAAEWAAAAAYLGCIWRRREQLGESWRLETRCWNVDDNALLCMHCFSAFAEQDRPCSWISVFDVHTQGCGLSLGQTLGMSAIPFCPSSRSAPCLHDAVWSLNCWQPSTLLFTRQAGGAMLARSVLLLGTKTMASAASTR